MTTTALRYGLQAAASVTATVGVYLAVCKVLRYTLVSTGAVHAPPGYHPATPVGDTDVEATTCVTCCQHKRDTVFMPCGHLIVCGVCAPHVVSPSRP